MADVTDATQPASVVIVQVDVDRHVWKYMTKSATYQRKVDDIGGEYGTPVLVTDAESGEQVSLQCTGQRASEARALLLKLIDECQQSINKFTIQDQDDSTCSTVTDNLTMFEDDQSALVDVDSATGVIRLTGTKDEIVHALGLLEILGVAIPAVPNEQPASTTTAVNEVPPPSLQLWKEQEADRVDEEENIYASQDGDSPAATVIVDAKLWKYLQKSNGQWVAQITQVRDVGVVISESLTPDGSVSLTFAGVKDDVVKATERMRQLVDRCRNVVQTVDVVCPDSAVRAKVLKFLSHVNKSPAYVVVESDKSLTATGTMEELDECATSKLAKLGASLARVNSDAEDYPGSRVRTDVASDDEPLPNTPWLNVDSKGNSEVKQDLEEDARLARQLQEQENAQMHIASASTHVSRPSDDGEQEGRQYGEIPVPMEDALWSFVERRRASQLQQLREAYKVTISSHPAAQEGFVVIAIQAQSALMLESAKDELIQLLENLRGSIVVQVLQTSDEQGGRRRQLPPQVALLFTQLAEGTDAIIEVKNNNICITGPERAVGECQQKIATVVQQVQQQEGAGGMGGLGGGSMRLGGGRGGGMDLPPQMTDAQMARYMRTRGTQLPGGGGGGGYDVAMGAMMGGSGSRAAGPGAYGGFLGMPTGASSFAPFASQPTGEFDMGGRRAESMWPPQQRPTGGLDRPGVGGSMTQRTFDSGARDTNADSMFDRMPVGAGGSCTFPADQPPTQQSVLPGQLQQQQDTSIEKSADKNSVSHEMKPRVVRFADEQLNPASVPSTNVHEPSDANVCSVCQHSELDEDSGMRCQHAFCVSCVQQYFSASQHICPVCGIDDESRVRALATQPADGIMMVTYDNAFRLPGYETTSRGTIVVCYSFPPGVQKDSQPNPGQKYSGVSYTAFFPLSMEGSSVVDLLQRAFDNRQVFALMPTSDRKTEELTWNGIHHKTNIYGGPKKCGYPDPVYLTRVQHELHNKGFR